MPMTSTKNAPLSAAGMGLGLGDMLQTEVQNTIDENAKKRRAMMQSNAVGALNPNTAGISSAVASLLGNQTAGA